MSNNFYYIFLIIKLNLYIIFCGFENNNFQFFDFNDLFLL